MAYESTDHDQPRQGAVAGVLAALIAVSLWFTLTAARYDDPFRDFEPPPSKRTDRCH